jgi:hypothetical protein
MASKTLTISVTQEDYDYLNEDGLLSPTSIFRVAMQQIRESRENLQEEIKRLRIANSVLQTKLLDAQDGK